MIATQIKKLFFPLSSDNQNEIKDIIYQTVNLVLDFLKSCNDYKIHPQLSSLEIAEIFKDEIIPEKNECILKILQQSFNDIAKNSVRVDHPCNIGHMTGATPFFMLLCDFIISALNQNMVKIETALSATYVERQVLGWLHQLIYNKEASFHRYIYYQC